MKNKYLFTLVVCFVISLAFLVVGQEENPQWKGTIEEEDGKRIIRMCGAEMSCHMLVDCAECGIPFITQEHLDYIGERADIQAKIKYPRNLCPACARRVRAETFRREITLY